MTVTQIIGPRVAPLWADPVEWTSTRAYEPFTFVTYQGDSYCSRQDTPIGIDITNNDYWVKVSDYNAQAVALQRSMTQTIETAESNMESTIQSAENAMTEQVNAVESVKNDFQSAMDDATLAGKSLLLRGKKAVVFGDSTAANAPSYFNIVAEKTGMTITNRAIAGTSLGVSDSNTWNSAASVSDNSGYSLIRRQTDLANFDIVFLAYSTNDWQASRRLKNAGMDGTCRVSFYGFVQKIVEYIQSVAPKAFVVFVAPAFAHRVWPNSYTNVNFKGFTLRDYALAARQVMYDMHMGFIDLGNTGVNENNYKSWFYDDSGGIFVHYNEQFKEIVANCVIGSYPWLPEPVNTPEAINKSSYYSTYIDPISIATPLTSTDDINTEKSIPRRKFLVADKSFICNCNRFASGSNTVYLTPSLDFTNGLTILAFVISENTENFILAAENTDYQAVYATIDYGWVAMHIPATNARGRISMRHQSSTASGTVICSCVVSCENVLCMPHQIRYYNISGFINSDNGTVNGQCGYSDTLHMNVVIKNHGQSMILFKTLPSWFPMSTIPRWYSYNTYVTGGIGYLSAAYTYQGDIEVQTESTDTKANWSLIV